MGILNILRFVWNHPLNAERRLPAIGRMIRWQIGSRLLPGPVGLPFADGTHLFATRGMSGATGNWYCGLHEAAEMSFVLHALRPTDLFVDVGANIGSYTILASGAAGARTIAVEPIPATFRNLLRNVRLNGLDDIVRCEQLGLSDTRGTLRFTDHLDTVNHIIADDDPGVGIAVPVTTLDELTGADVPAVVKIDVEGYELSVLRGGQRILGDERLLAVILETNGSGARYGVHDSELLGIMSDYGFEPFGYDPTARRLSEGMPSGGGNTLFLRNIQAVAERVRNAPRYRLVNGSV